MIRLVTAKLASYPSFWKFLAFQIAAILCAVYMASHLGNFEVNGSPLPLADWFTLPQAWRTVCAIARWFYFIPAFFVVQLISAELELRLVRAQVIAGLTRRDVVASWFLLNVALTLVAVLASLAAALLFTHHPAAGTGWDASGMLRQMSGLALYGLVFLNITMLCTTILRRPVPTLAFLIMWPLFLEQIVSYLLSQNGLEKLTAYLPFASLGSLVSFSGEPVGLDLSSPLSLACALYGLAAAGLTWLRLRQIDL